jgi:hypothetical protein
MPESKKNLTPRKKQLLGLLLAFFGTSLLLGYLSGRKASPDVNSVEVFQAEVARNAHLITPLEYSKTYFPDGRLKSLSAKLRYTFPCLPREYTFDSTASTVSSKYSVYSAKTYKVPHEDVSFEDSFMILLGGREAYALPETYSGFWEYVETGSSEEHLRLLVEIPVVLVSGFATGFYLGYHDKISCTGSDSYLLTQKDWWQAALSERVGSDADVHGLNLQYESNSALPLKFLTPNGEEQFVVPDPTKCSKDQPCITLSYGNSAGPNYLGQSPNLDELLMQNLCDYYAVFQMLTAAHENKLAASLTEFLLRQMEDQNLQTFILPKGFKLSRDTAGKVIVDEVTLRSIGQELAPRCESGERRLPRVF